MLLHTTDQTSNINHQTLPMHLHISNDLPTLTIQVLCTSDP